MKTLFYCQVCPNTFLANLSAKRKYCSRPCYDKKQKAEPNIGTFVKDHKSGMTARKHRDETKYKISAALTGHVFYGGSSGWFKKGNIPSTALKPGNIPWNKGTSLNPDHSLRMSKEYSEWRIAVFVRDNYTCQECGFRGGKLNADHILPFALFPELRLDVGNGRTLCVYCHRQTPTFGYKGIQNRLLLERSVSKL